MASNQTSQGMFRFRNDDGSESAASWYAAESANATLTIGSTFRVRFRLFQNLGAATRAYKLQYLLNPDAFPAPSWTDVNGSSSVLRSTSSAYVTDNTATTRQLSATGNFTDGVVDTADGATQSVTIQSGGLLSDTEEEFCVNLRTADVIAGDVIRLRIVASTGTLLDAYNTTPEITAAGMATIHGSLSQTLADWTLSSAGKVKIQASLTVTLADWMLAATTSSAIHGALAKTLDDWTLSAHVGVTPPGTQRVSLSISVQHEALLATITTPQWATISITEPHAIALRLEPLSIDMDPQNPLVGQQIRLGMLFYNDDVLTDPSTITLVRKDGLGTHTTTISGLTHLGTGSYCLDTTVLTGAGLTHWYVSATGINAVALSSDAGTNYTVRELPF